MTTAQLVEQELQRRGFKIMSGEWRGPSPFRPESDGQSFAVDLKDSDGEHGTGFDHVTKQGYSLYQIAEALGIETPKADSEQPTTKRGYDSLDDYAKAHGVDGDMFRSALWQETTYQGRKALEFPTATGKRWRFLDGGKQKFTSVQGYKKCWYGLDRAIETASKYDYPLVLCNGEPSVVAATYHGLPACCVTSGEDKIPDNLLLELKQKWSGRIIIAMDCDDTGRSAAVKIASQLLDREYAIADLGLDNHGDLADFCMLHGDGVTGALLLAAGDFKQPAQDVLTAAATLQLAEALTGVKVEVSKDKRLQSKQNLAQQIAQTRALCDSLESETGQGQTVGVGDVVSKARARLTQRLENPGVTYGLSTGLPKLDSMVSFVGSRLYTFMGDTGMGKSTLVASLAGQFLRQGAGVVAATETQAIDWLDKLAAYITLIPVSNIMKGALSPQQAQQVFDVYDKLEASYIEFVDIPQPTPAQIRAALYKAQTKFGRVQWCIVDSASKCMGPGEIYQRMTHVYDGLHTLAQDFDIPVIATSQVKRDLSDRPIGKKRPQLHDMYGGDIGAHNSDVVFGVYRHDYYVKLGVEEPSDNLPENSALLTILKARFDDGGDVACKLMFRGGCGYYDANFREVSLDSRKHVA